MKYRVRFVIDEEVEEADNKQEAIEIALCENSTRGWYEENSVTEYIRQHAQVEKIEEEERSQKNDQIR